MRAQWRLAKIRKDAIQSSQSHGRRRRYFDADGLAVPPVVDHEKAIGRRRTPDASVSRLVYQVQVRGKWLAFSVRDLERTLSHFATLLRTNLRRKSRRACPVFQGRLPFPTTTTMRRDSHVQCTCVSVVALAAVPTAGSRDVSDPRTDPGVRVRGPEVGSLTPQLLSCAGHPRGKRRRAIVCRTDPTAVGKLNVLQEKRSRVRRGGRSGRRFQFDEPVSMFRG